MTAVAFADSVRVHGSTSGADSRTDRRALLAACDGAHTRTRSRGSGHREFVTMFLPESSFVTIVTVAHRGARSSGRRRLRPRNRFRSEGQSQE